MQRLEGIDKLLHQSHAEREPRQTDRQTHQCHACFLGNEEESTSFGCQSYTVVNWITQR